MGGGASSITNQPATTFTLQNTTPLTPGKANHSLVPLNPPPNGPARDYLLAAAAAALGLLPAISDPPPADVNVTMP